MTKGQPTRQCRAPRSRNRRSDWSHRHVLPCAENIMRPLRLVILFSMFCAGGVSAQPTSGQVQPDRIFFGNVHAGATVEARFMVLERGDDKSVKFEVTAPKLV